MDTPKISLIACINKNRGLGFQNQLLYKIPEDMKFFREKTKGAAAIMGKNTFLSIGRPLPDRTNIVITRDADFKAEGCVVCNGIDDALKAGVATGRPIFIIGGAQIYQQTIDKADRLYLTIVDDDKEADAFFPSYDEFKKTTLLSQGDYNDLKYQILMLERQ